MRTHVYTQGGKPMLAALGHMGLEGLARLHDSVGGTAVWPAPAGDPPLKAGRVVAAVAVTAIVLLYALANFWPGFPSLGRLDDILVINDDWGTYRGTAWRITWSTWLDQPLWRKIIGVGHRHDAHRHDGLGGQRCDRAHENLLCGPQ